mmetsp:Transcript_2946/g.6201  ORF Transcript_2946/g.6201 Transcript_2946/m.6201 type:complete len:307 (-) Transcript_2946:17-937(-)
MSQLHPWGQENLRQTSQHALRTRRPELLEMNRGSGTGQRLLTHLPQPRLSRSHGWEETALCLSVAFLLNRQADLLLHAEHESAPGLRDLSRRPNEIESSERRDDRPQSASHRIAPQRTNLLRQSRVFLCLGDAAEEKSETSETRQRLTPVGGPWLSVRSQRTRITSHTSQPCRQQRRGFGVGCFERFSGVVGANVGPAPRRRNQLSENGCDCRGAKCDASDEVNEDRGDTSRGRRSQQFLWHKTTLEYEWGEGRGGSETGCSQRSESGAAQTLSCLIRLLSRWGFVSKRERRDSVRHPPCRELHSG